MQRGDLRDAFSIVALALFWLRTPVESWIGTGPIRARLGTNYSSCGPIIGANIWLRYVLTVAVPCETNIFGN